MNDIVVADRLAKSYGNTRALEDASFSVGSGECVVILGPNGAGKTTLMEILEGTSRRARAGSCSSA
jgi:ABC-2 type transport system ATP-binding protein